MKFSIGKVLTAGTSNTLFTVPTGYHCVVSMLFITNVGASTKSVSAAWHDGTVITFQGSKSVNAGEHIQFGGASGFFLVMSDGDYLTVTPEASSSFNAIVSFELYPHNPSNFNLTI